MSRLILGLKDGLGFVGYGVVKLHPPTRVWLLATLACGLILVSPLGAEPRVFTDKEGRSIAAELISVKGDVVTLKRGDGQVYTVQKDIFSEADIQYLEEQEKAAAASAIPVLGPEPAPPNSVVIESLIDGATELRVKKDGIYWISGPAAKPGRHLGQEFPTYVDGKSWRPVWKEPRKERGTDRSATKSVAGLDPHKIEFKLLNVTLNQGGHGIEKRDPILLGIVEEELSIIIPDSQGGSRWYRFALIKKE